MLDEQKNARLQACIDKVSMMQKLAFKQEYSRPIYIKRHLLNQVKLNAYLGIGFDVDWQSSKRGSELPDNVSDFSVKTHDLLAINEKEAVTYQQLLEHIENAEKHYENIRAFKGIAAPAGNASTDAISRQGSRVGSNSGTRRV